MKPPTANFTANLRKDWAIPSALRPQANQTATTTMPPPVIAPLRLDGRAWFANERTFLSWMGISSTLAAFAGGLAFVGEGGAAQTATVLLLAAASLVFVLYATRMHYVRASQLRRRCVSAYDDRFGAGLLLVVMTVAVLANLGVALAHSLHASDKFEYRYGT